VKYAYYFVCFVFPRVSHAIDADTERLEEERMAYGHAVVVEKERLDNLEAALRTSHWSPEASRFESHDLIQRYDLLLGMEEMLLLFL
jgi:hypothetical protein